MGRVCELIDEHCDVDFVDLNMGCPIELVCRKGGGAALQSQVEALLQLLHLLASCVFAGNGICTFA